MNDASHEKTLIGVDIGGSGVRAATFESSGSGPRWTCQGLTVARLDPGDPGELARGIEAVLLARIEASTSDPSPGPHSRRRVFVGLAAPGCKTRDRRGIASARNMVSAPNLLDDLDAGLRAASRASIQLGRVLSSDAEAALVGETQVQGGVGGSTGQTLYVGLGSGLGEASLRNGRMLPHPEPRADAIPPLFDDGLFLDREQELSLSALARAFRCGQDPQSETVLIEEAAAMGDRKALELLERTGLALADLIKRRLQQPMLDLRQPLRILVRTQRGRFFGCPIVRGTVLPPVRTEASRVGAELLEPSPAYAPTAACAGALKLALRLESFGGERKP